jgi:hypothetical protein
MEEINNLTIKEAKEKLKQYEELKAIFNIEIKETEGINNIDKQYIGQKALIRTYAAGVWFGTITQKSGNEIILYNARRLWYWKAKQSISLSAVAKYGIDASSRIAPIVDNVWLQPIEIIDCTLKSIKSIEESEDAKQN